MCHASKIKAPAVNALVLIISIAILIAPTGCATTKEAYPPPLPKETRNRLGRIGVACADTQPQIWLGQKPMGKSEGAWEGTKEGAGAMLNLAKESGRGGDEVGALFSVFFIILSVFAGATGLVVGAAKGVSKEDVRQAEADMARLLPELDIQGSMRDSLLDAAGKEKAYVLDPVDLTGHDVMYGRPDFESLAGDGLDSLLRIGVLDIELSGKKGIDPELQFRAKVLVRLDSVNDGSKLYCQIFEYSGNTRKFCEWAVDDARPLRDEFDNFYRSTAADIVERLFVMEAK